MESRAKFLGHPVHQMLIPLPAGLLIVAPLLDIADLFVDAGWIPTVTFWNLVLGVLSGLLAAAFGLADWIKIPPHTRAKRIGAFHAIGNTLAIGLFAAAIVLRWRGVLIEQAVPLLLEVVALGLLCMSAWLGGELVDRLGVGVSDGAHVDAPSSLRGKPTYGVVR